MWFHEANFPFAISSKLKIYENTPADITCFLQGRSFGLPFIIWQLKLTLHHSHGHEAIRDENLAVHLLAKHFLTNRCHSVLHTGPLNRLLGSQKRAVASFCFRLFPKISCLLWLLLYCVHQNGQKFSSLSYCYSVNWPAESEGRCEEWGSSDGLNNN